MSDRMKGTHFVRIYEYFKRLTNVYFNVIHIFTRFYKLPDLRICTYKLCSRNCNKCTQTNLLHKILRYCTVFNLGSILLLIIVFKYKISCVFILKRNVNAGVILHTNHSDTIFMAIVVYETFL